jgi:hypothetical protein
MIELAKLFLIVIEYYKELSASAADKLLDARWSVLTILLTARWSMKANPPKAELAKG